ncbi:hypothetical protein [Geodermatophilus sp. SYSU D00684]
MMDVVVGVTAVVALLVSVAAFLYSRRSTLAAERSATEAKRSADASERSADVTQREEQRAQVEAEERAVRWRLERTGSAAATLTDVGEGAALDVHVEVPESMRVIGARTTAAELPAGGQLMVRVARRMSAPADSHITVRWRNRPGGPWRTQSLLEQ